MMVLLTIETWSRQAFAPSVRIPSRQLSKRLSEIEESPIPFFTVESPVT